MTALPTTVDDAYNAANPDVPLYEGEADPRYVDLTGVRGGDDLATLIARRIRRSDRTPSPVFSKLLFTGHRGCGGSMRPPSGSTANRSKPRRNWATGEKWPSPCITWP